VCACHPVQFRNNTATTSPRFSIPLALTAWRITQVAPAANWPQWLGPNRSGICSEHRELARQQVLHGRECTVPVLANGRLYCRNNAGTVVCLQIASDWHGLQRTSSE
jgi:hypothetical protein